MAIHDAWHSCTMPMLSPAIAYHFDSGLKNGISVFRYIS